MKIINYKLNSSKIILLIFLILLGIYVSFLSDGIGPIISMNSRNFTNILDDIHHNAYEYSGDTIKLSGYVYRALDFSPNQFVIARNMKVSNNEYRIVGFLCEYKDIDSFSNNTWVQAKGTITLGDYHGPIPIIKIIRIRETKAPNDITVLPPQK